MLKKLSTGALIVLIGIGVMVLIISVTACSTPVEKPAVKTKFSGDHTTPQIRGMWSICYQSRMRGLPHIPPPVHGAHCDCLVDGSRERYSSGDYGEMGSDNLTNVFSELSALCNLMQIPKINPAST